MGLFDDQLKARRDNDREAMGRSLSQLGAAVLGKDAPVVGSSMAEDAVQEIFAWFKVKAPEPPSLMTDSKFLPSASPALSCLFVICSVLCWNHWTAGIWCSFCLPDCLPACWER